MAESDFTKTMELDLREIPDLREMVRRHDEVLFSHGEVKASGMEKGLVPYVHELRTTFTISKRMLYAFLAFLGFIVATLGVLVGMVWELLKEAGIAKHLLGGG